MSASATPKQGDHVFNAVETAILRPFDTIRSLRSAHIDGQHFLQDYLLNSYSLVRMQAEAPVLIAAREFVASAGAEEEALRELKSLSMRHPALMRVTPSVLREIHTQNSVKFGNAAERFEIEVLRAVQHSLEAAVAPRGAPPPRTGASPSPGIAYQQMLDAAYDPAAALVVITNSMSRENPPLQGAFQPLIFRIAESLETPGMWKEPYANSDKERLSPAGKTVTGNTITGIRDVFMKLDYLKGPSMAFAAWIRDEIARNARSPGAGAGYGAMLHLLHGQLQRTRRP